MYEKLPQNWKKKRKMKKKIKTYLPKLYLYYLQSFEGGFTL